ncbi:DegV family protein [Tissierella sp. Yu-01]|uniref:DegV family protein n=1 Tax=Tissierella sp. Yu-01 TaxID=3035694 RepID=UPI00240D6F35|nr:DegV family protein [Tissierella sp. Yu-01]WFA10290.1 DegV family protein [Tissierella sp. Yu-01]
MLYKIVADSSCDLNEDLVKKVDISLVPFKIDVDDHSFIDDESIDVPKLIKEMNSSPNPIKTSCPSPGDFAAEYEDGENVFVVTISEQLSGTYNSAILAKDMAIEKSPNKFIHVFNSKSASVGETLTALKIKECIDNKLSNSQIVEKVEKFIEDMKTYFISENLDNLIKNGRISKTKGLIINALNIVPVMRATENGNIDLVDKARGSKKAFKKLVDIIGESGVNFEERILAISHANALQKALDLKEDLKKYNFKDIIIVQTKGLSTGYVNDGGIIVAF